MTKYLSGAKFYNVEKFEEFLFTNVKWLYDVDAFLEDLDRFCCDNGVSEYELTEDETKNGVPVIITFDVKNIPIDFDENGEATQWDKEYWF